MLKDLEIKAAKAEAKPYKLSDGQGLFVRVMPSGTKLFQVRYRFEGKEQLYSLGAWGQSGTGTSLREAREGRDVLLRQVRAGVNPMAEKRNVKVRETVNRERLFETTSARWFEVWKTHCSSKHAADAWRRLKTDVSPHLDHLPMEAITSRVIMSQVLGPIQDRGATDWVRRARQTIGAIFEFAQIEGTVSAGYNPASRQLDRLLKAKPEVEHQAALQSVEEIRRLLADVESFRAKPITRLANRFLALSALRTSEMRHTTWKMIEWTDDGGIFLRLPPHVMKMNRAFDIKACTALADLLKVLHKVTGSGKYLFPSDRAPDKPISENGVLSLLKRAGYQKRHSGHGYRASFSTIMNERRPGMHRVIDAALSHFTSGVEGAYNRAKHIDGRYELQNEYANLILEGARPVASLLDRRGSE